MDIVELQKWAYVPDLPDDIGPIRRLLQEYSRIPAKDVNAHILRVVRAASPFPFLERTLFELTCFGSARMPGRCSDFLVLADGSF